MASNSIHSRARLPACPGLTLQVEDGQLLTVGAVAKHAGEVSDEPIFTSFPESPCLFFDAKRVLLRRMLPQIQLGCTRGARIRDFAILLHAKVEKHVQLPASHAARGNLLSAGCSCGTASQLPSPPTKRSRLTPLISFDLFSHFFGKAWL